MEFRVCYENQKDEFVKKKIELGIPVILPSEFKKELESIGIELPDNDQTDGKKSKKKIGADKDKIAPSSILMIGIAIAMAALTGD